jgi:YidC/Oxa1 family membrane protein insertase
LNIFGVLIVRPFGIILNFIYSAVQNYGLAIICFAILAKLCMLPLGIKSKKSMIAMNRIQPRLQQIQKQYANNREKMGVEMQKLYDEEKISPMGGCLPQLIILPIMMGLYYAVQRPLTYVMGLYEDDIALLAGKVGIDLAANNTYTVQITIAEALNKFLDASGQFTQEILGLSENIGKFLIPLDFNFLGLNLAEQPSIKHLSVLWVIPILSGLTAFLSSWALQKLQGTKVEGSMKTMMFMMPLMSVYFAFILPASIGIYWIANNLLAIVQEFILQLYFKKRHPELYETQKPLSGKKKKKLKEQKEE